MCFHTDRRLCRLFELFTWLVEVTEDPPEPHDDVRVVWSVRYEPPQDEASATSYDHKSEGRKSTTKLEIQKDDIQAVVPISKVRHYSVKCGLGIRILDIRSCVTVKD